MKYLFRNDYSFGAHPKVLEAVCAASGMPDLQNQLQLQTLTAGHTDVERCIRYLRDTAGDFEALERELSAKL